MTDQNVCENEIAFFAATAKDFWNEKGSFAALHRMNPCRLEAIVSRIIYHFERDHATDTPLSGLKILDIGCGGGMVCEPLARLGAKVTGLDLAENLLEVARLHAADQGLEIDYRALSAEELAQKEGGAFDVVLALEILEHLPNPSDFIESIKTLVNPQGLSAISTLNRSPQAYIAAILIAERVLRWLPKGAHHYKQFITPEELTSMSEKAGLNVEETLGLVYNPLEDHWSLDSQNCSVNYISFLKNYQAAPPIKPPLSWI